MEDQHANQFCSWVCVPVDVVADGIVDAIECRVDEFSIVPLTTNIKYNHLVRKFAFTFQSKTILVRVLRFIEEIFWFFCAVFRILQWKQIPKLRQVYVNYDYFMSNHWNHQYTVGYTEDEKREYWDGYERPDFKYY